MTELLVGAVISRSFSILFKNFVPFMLLTAIVHVPLIAVLVFFGSGAGSVGEEGALGVGFATGLGTFLLNTIASAAVIYGVFQQLRGQHVSMGACITVGLGRLLTVLGVGILTIICIGLGYMALIIPGIIITFMLHVAVPVAVVENPGAIESLKRSKELTDGFKANIFGVVFVLALIGGGCGLILGIFMEILPGIAGVIAKQGVEIFFGALSAVATGVIYHDLRVIKDGVNVDDLVRVFE